MMSGHGTVETAVEATRLGAFDFVEKPLSLAKLLKTVERALDSGRVRRRDPVRQLVPRVLAPVGKSVVMRGLREDVAQVARHGANVLFCGESGSGRGSFARYLHSLSPRASGPFVSVACSAIDDDNASALLLGVEGQPGYLARADGGSVYLSRIEDLGDRAQRVLLGVLESGAIQTSEGSRPVDLHFISSSGPGIDKPGVAPSLRQELLAHLGVVKMRVPPLREYSEDVPELLNHFSDQLADAEGLPIRKFSVAAQNRLRNYPWPGNIRDLRNLVHRLLMTGDGENVSLEEVERHLGSEPTANMPLVKQDLLALPLREAREQFERAYLKQQLSLCGGKVGKLAQRVGMERTHLYRKLRTLGVDFGHGNTDD
jgi:DNA-binding NtrC family response regulator